MDAGRGELLLVGAGPVIDAVREPLADRLTVPVRVVDRVDAARDVLAEGSIVTVVSAFDVPDAGNVEHLRGLEVLEAARETNPDLPVLLISERGNRDAVQEALVRDVTDYVLLDGIDQPGIEHLVGRIERAVEARLAELRAAEQARITEVIRDVNGGLVRATSREDAFRTVAERLTEADPYAAAAVCVDGGVAVAAGESIDDDLFVAVCDDADGPTLREDLSSDEPAPWGTLAGVGYVSAVTVPVRHRDVEYGRLVVLSRSPGAIDDTQREILAELGATTGYAVDAVETRHRLERQNERLDEFASMVSHDLRNPLTVVRGRIDLLAEEAGEEHLDPVERSVDRMEQIVDDMLALAREGRMADDTEPLSIEAVVREVWETIDDDGAALDVTDDLSVEAAPGALRELFENLLRNAVEHGGTPDDGGDYLTVTVGSFADGDRAGFFVADDGPGIPSEDRDDVFEFGFTTDDSGSGYGLPIVERIADAHGWDVELVESEGGGARFEITGCG